QSGSVGLIGAEGIMLRSRAALAFACPKTKKGGGLLRRPLGLERTIYFRLVIAVRSAESLTMPVAPHQLEPTPVGLMEEKLLLNTAVWSLVKALQLAFDRSVSE